MTTDEDIKYDRSLLGVRRGNYRTLAPFVRLSISTAAIAQASKSEQRN